MMIPIWTLARNAQVSAAASEATSANYKAREVARYCEYLEQRIEKLTLICRAIWSFVEQATDLTEQDLAERMKEIDLSDGVLDGKVQRHAVACAKCGRMIAVRHNNCIWCGAERPAGSAFDQV